MSVIIFILGNNLIYRNLLKLITIYFTKKCLDFSCYDTYVDKNIHFFMYLLMPELKSILLNVLQDLINHLIYNISEVHTFFPLKDFISNVVYLYLTDCEIDVKNTSLENINVSIKLIIKFTNVEYISLIYSQESRLLPH